MNEVEFFKAVLKEQIVHDRDKFDQVIDVMDVTLQDIIAVGWENKPGIKKMGHGKFEITARTGNMTAYAGGETSGVRKTGQAFDRSELEVKYVRGYFTMTHVQLVAVTQSDNAAVITAADEYITDIKMSIMRAKSRMLRGDGSGISGVLDAIWPQTGTSIVIATRAAWAVDSHNIYGLGTDEFQPWEPIIFGTKADFVAGTGIEAVIATVADKETLELVAPVTVGAAASANNRGGTNADTIYIVRGTNAQNEYGQVAMWLLGLIDDGTFVPTLQTKVRASTPYMRSDFEKIATTGNILVDFQDLYRNYRKYGKAKYFRVSSDVYQKYATVLTATYGTHVSNAEHKTVLESGFGGLAFNYASSWSIPIIEDLFMPSGQVLLIDPSQMFEASLFMDDFLPDYIMSKIDAGTEIAYETLAASYFNFGTYWSRKLGARINYNSVT